MQISESELSKGTVLDPQLLESSVLIIATQLQNSIIALFLCHLFHITHKIVDEFDICFGGFTLLLFTYCTDGTISFFLTKQLQDSLRNLSALPQALFSAVH